MTDDTEADTTSGTTDDAPTDDPRWDELREDAAAIAEEYGDDGWDTVVLEPAAVDAAPSETDERGGLEAIVSETEYGLLEALVERDDVAVDEAEVYYRPSEGDERRFALAVERDTSRGIAVCLPLTYRLTEAQTHAVFETALADGELLVHVRSSDGPADADQRVTFSHDDPLLFLEDSDVQARTGTEAEGDD
ncbi:DUF7529 family protein [Halopiger xanaduensis]|uniref:Uncharacterized protein n=1 Tax=Halopiger xanaduensis (strain DSM 18323 / JCM 14033 / SH-6) TaxID=797210 RepID=F8D535_HALXS|nr:hypothetical protein [Halopiger xanaduensis]AEH36387.1 hypothetical protein Halxa_1759 [Halopiger xanaduensis SH-6]